MTDTNEIANETAIERGKRLRMVRNMAGLSSEQLAAEAGYSRATISYWENASLSGLNEKGAEKVAKAVEKHGIFCHQAWLLYGIGEPPRLIPSSSPHALIFTGNPKKQIIEDNSVSKPLMAEIHYFKAHYPNAVVIQIEQDVMQPLFEKNDWLGGCWQPIKENCYGKPCIILNNHLLEVRILNPGTEPNKYHLNYLSQPEALLSPFQLIDITLHMVAPIARVWREL